MPSLTVIVLTYNEHLHIERCLKSLQAINADVFVIDSFSSDNTRDIAFKYGASFFQNPWSNHANQINWALDNCSIKTDWVMRVDADEYLSTELINSINNDLKYVAENVSGIRIKRLMYFMGKPLKYGGMYPIWHLKIWKNGKARCEQRWMDERMIISEGVTVELNGDLIDNNLNNLTWWTAKHNGYATREAIDILDKIYGFTGVLEQNANLFGNSEQRRRWIKLKYLKMPLFIRPFLFFVIRYFLQLGFLEGKRGFIWSVLQCFWYRFLVDAKVNEALKAGHLKEDLVIFFKKEYNIDVCNLG
ncbi:MULTISPECIES: glycosyltransferase family 2 protein [Sphingobacterium]|uniref:glycosyltransferase family 2 protein n=1 Tax=Sphingobacterium TaxID=28453 RepID=UPI002579C80B|nr:MULTISPECIES: glycosyltransferase family 2 protein [Sphingobacterium]